LSSCVTSRFALRLFHACVEFLLPPRVEFDTSWPRSPNRSHSRQCKSDGLPNYQRLLPLVVSPGHVRDDRTTDSDYRAERYCSRPFFFSKRSRKGEDATWQFFDLSKDQSEIDTVIEEHREVAAEMIDDWKRFVADVGIVCGYDKYFDDKKANAEPQK